MYLINKNSLITKIVVGLILKTVLQIIEQFMTKPISSVFAKHCYITSKLYENKNIFCYFETIQ